MFPQYDLHVLLEQLEGMIIYAIDNIMISWWRVVKNLGIVCDDILLWFGYLMSVQIYWCWGWYFSWSSFIFTWCCNIEESLVWLWMGFPSLFVGTCWIIGVFFFFCFSRHLCSFWNSCFTLICFSGLIRWTIGCFRIICKLFIIFIKLQYILYTIYFMFSL